MKYWTEYQSHNSNIMGKKKKFDNNIYSFDIETTSYIILNGKQYKSLDYLNFSESDRKECEFKSNMYIWMFSINQDVYYGRTWEEFRLFIIKLDSVIPELKYVYVHNLAFEFQYLKSVFNFKSVVARKAHKVMSAVLLDHNIEFRCSYILSNCSLDNLANTYKLPVKKLVGNLDYSLIRHSKTMLSEQELAYCENDCLVIYEYIKLELETYETIKNIPLTSTGHVRRELQDLIRTNYRYKRIVNKAINTDPHIYNLLLQAFMGGYTHSNWIHTDTIINDVDSWDFTSSYPYVMVTNKFPSTEFKKCIINSISDMSDRFAYILVVKFNNIKSKFYNNFISVSKCRNIKGGKYDNGRVMKAKELEITLTDIDFKFILASHDIESYEIKESYFSNYNYLPKDFINFILDKYVIKTEYKNVPGKEIVYQLEKGKFNSLYGMSVTNTIRDEVIYNNITGWEEVPLTNEDIIEQLNKEKNKSFLSFAYGVWVTAYARYNLLSNVIKLDEDVIYCDTDSIKLRPGYNKKIIDDYNRRVNNKINFVAKILNIPVNKYKPKDSKGIERMLGVFDDDGHYEEFITQGAKKYAVKQDGKIKITVAGVPKRGSKALKDLNDFRDDFVFEYKDTNKNLLMYVENEDKFILEDYKGEKYEVSDKSGCCVVPTTYVLGKALEYTNLISDNSSNRSIYIEEE